MLLHPEDNLVGYKSSKILCLFLCAFFAWRRAEENSQFYGLVPHDDVTRQDERLDVDDVRVAALRPHIQPFALEGKVAKRDPGRGAETV